jgi:outer membrane protein assembly factor BamB
VVWKTKIPGLAHSSPIIWGDRVYLTTAVTDDAHPELVIGDVEVGGIRAADDMGKHSWRLYALDRKTGEILWHKTAHEGVPRIKRHVKASHASQTPATDGTHVVALFGSEGLYCFDMDGNLLWKKDVGLLDVGLWGEPEYQWGPGSSPVIYKNLVVLQNDRQQDSFLAAYDIRTGEEVWRTKRNEKPAWSTPAIYHGERAELITNSANYFYGYDPLSGKEFWRLSNDDAQVITPTPIISDDLVIITGGYPTGSRPIYAIRPGGEGDISPAEGETSNEYLAWKTRRGSPYTPTPLAYNGILYACVDNGILSAYDLKTGERLYQKRLAVGAGFSASPVASDGKLYFLSEDGDVFVVKAGPEYELISMNEMGETLMASPAISDGVLIVRGRDHLFAIGAQAEATGRKPTDSAGSPN